MEKTFKIVFGTVVLCIISISTVSSVEYNHPCDEATPELLCNPLKPYICPAGKCVCSHATNMYYDPTRETCVVNAETLGCFEIVSTVIPVHCTPNAHCDSTEINMEGTCKCQTGTMQDGPYCKLGFGMGACNTTRECATSAFLECGENSTCTCAPLFTWSNDKCLGLVGASCSATQPCSSATTMDCPTPTNKCACKPTHEEFEGACLVPHDGTCASDEECHPTFPHCATDTNTCQCSVDKEFNAVLGKCVSLFGSTCDADNPCNTYSHCNNETSVCDCDATYTSIDSKYCKGTFDASCTVAPADDCQTGTGWNLHCNTTLNKCMCNPDHKQTEEGACLLDYNKPCTDNAQCHPDAPLCLEDPDDATVKLCGCAEGEKYDGTRSQCRIMFDRACNVTSDLCYTHSHCSDVSNACTCNDNYSPEGDICLGNFGAACTRFTDTEHDCKPGLFLVCNESNTCSCAPNYEEDNGVCKGNLDAPCNDNSNCLVGNCLDTNPKVCGCPDKSISVGSSCESTYDGPCDGICHEPFRLACDVESNLCKCAENKHYNPGKNTTSCLNGAGDECENHSDCVENGNCNFGSGTGVCRCNDNFGNSNGICVRGGGGGADSIQSLAFLTILLPVVIAIFTGKM